MGTAKQDAEREVYETGNEPEFVVNDLPRYEEAGNGLIRVFVASFRGRLERIEYSFVCTPDTLSDMCRKGLVFASEAHNLIQFRKAITEH